MKRWVFLQVEADLRAWVSLRGNRSRPGNGARARTRRAAATVSTPVVLHFMNGWSPSWTWPVHACARENES